MQVPHDMSTIASGSTARPRRKRSSLGASLILAGVVPALAWFCATARAESPTRAVHAQASEAPAATDAHPVPRIKVSIEGFAVETPFATRVQLKGVHTEMYPVSRPWVRGGIGLAGGAGRGQVGDASASVQYGLLGGSFGAQFPGRVTPFIEGHLRGGFIAAALDRPVTVGSVRIENAAGTTWMYARGVDAGAELYVLGRLYISGALGWTRATWGSPDTRSLAGGGADMPGSSGELRFVDVTSDSLMWKLGVGI